MKGYEDDLIGKEIGYSGRVEIAPENAFGLHDPKNVEMVPLNRFKEEKPVPGMRVGMENRTGTVTRVIGRKVSVDFNHPLAGRTMVYEYTIREMSRIRSRSSKPSSRPSAVWILRRR